MNRALPVAAVTGALVVTAAAGSLAAVGAHHLSHQQQLDNARKAALAAGRQIAVDVASYNYKTIDADFTRVSKEATGKFQSDFTTQSAGVRDAIVAAKAVSTAQVASAGVVNATATTAQVVVALNRLVTNSQAPKGTQSALGVQLFLVKHGGRWLATDVKPL